MKRLRLGFVTIKRSCQTVILRGRPKRCRPLTFPAVLNRFKSQHGVNGCTLNFWATSVCEQPVVNIPRARCRLFSENFGRFPITCFCNFSPALLKTRALQVFLGSKLFPAVIIQQKPIVLLYCTNAGYHGFKKKLSFNSYNFIDSKTKYMINKTRFFFKLYQSESNC